MLDSLIDTILSFLYKKKRAFRFIGVNFDISFVFYALIVVLANIFIMRIIRWERHCLLTCIEHEMSLEVILVMTNIQLE